MSATETFRRLHHEGDLLLMPNAWDRGSARYLVWRGAAAIATTSSGFAATLGRNDQDVTRDELLAHAEAIVDAVDVPVSIDSERCYADDPDGVADTVRLLAATGAAGCSIEDYDPAAGAIDPLSKATERVEAAATEAARHGLVLTARAENHLYGIDDLDETIERLVAYRQAGAEVLYAPGLIDLAVIARVVSEVEAPINVLSFPSGPTVEELAGAGVRRVSTGGALAWAALGGLRDAMDDLLGSGTTAFTHRPLSGADRDAAFGS